MSRERDPRSGDELLPVLPEETERALASALRAAWNPSPIDPARNQALIELSIDDPLAPPSAQEVAESERLRRALEGDGDHPYAELARVIASAGRPSAIDSGRVGELICAPSAPEPEREREIEPVPSSKSRRANVIYVAFGAAAAALALAASLALFVGPLGESAPAGVATKASDIALSRSTASMFDEKFETEATTERVDRIALARARELRSNRYTLWGVR